MTGATQGLRSPQRPAHTGITLSEPLAARPRSRTRNARRRPFVGCKELVLTSFLMAGYFKGQSWMAWLPVDLTALTAIVTLAVVFWYLVRQRFTVPNTLWLVLPLFALVLPSLLWTVWTPYAAEKASRFFTLTLLAAVAPLVLIQTREHLRKFLNALTIAGLFIAAEAFYLFFAQPQVFDRLGFAPPVNPIAIGRAAGVSALWCIVLILSGRCNRLLAPAIVGLLAATMLGVGARGPLLAGVAAFAILLVLFYGNRLSTVLGTMALVAVVAVAVTLGSSVAPRNALLRVESLAGGHVGSSELSRVEYLRLSLDAIPSNPLGVGLGGFQSRVLPQSTRLGTSARDFPHNIVVEVLLEAGWPAGAYLLFLLGYAFHGCYRLARQSGKAAELVALFGLLAFMFVNDLVSGELNDDRILFALIAVTIAMVCAPGQTEHAGQHGAPAGVGPRGGVRWRERRD